MNAQTYLQKLNQALAGLSTENRNLVIDYYHDLIIQQQLENESEAVLNETFGSPSIIAASLLNKVQQKQGQQVYSKQGWQELVEDESSVFSNKEKQDTWHHSHNKQQSNKTTSTTYHDDTSADYQHTSIKSSPFQRFIQIFGLLLINLLIMIWLFLAIGFMILAGWIATLALLVTPIILIAAYFTPYLSYPHLSLSFGLIFFGLGILGFYICKILTKYFYRIVKYYIKANLHVLRGNY